MILKNYTTDKNYLRSIADIESILTKIGAKKIMKDYDDGQVSALSFQILFNEKEIGIRLPARIDRVPSALRNVYNTDKTLKPSQKSLIKKAMEDNERARNIGWRIIQDWLEAQVAIMQLDQLNMLEALLPFTIVKNGKTLYELLENSDFKFDKMAQNMIEYKTEEGYK